MATVRFAASVGRTTASAAAAGSRFASTATVSGGTSSASATAAAASGTSSASAAAAAVERCSPLVDRILRVDHAGELGADRIYAGQMAVLGRTSVGAIIQHMWDQEKEHKATFERLIPQYRARPTFFLPLWHVAGFALGAGSALLGRESAMACTVAVESVITDHYNQQIRSLTEHSRSTGQDHTQLLQVISKFRDEEMEHHDTGLSHDAEQAPGYQLLSAAVKLACRGAIWASERI